MSADSVQKLMVKMAKLQDSITASIIENAKSLNVLAAIAIPEVMAFLFPPMYLYFWKKCTELVSGTRGFPKVCAVGFHGAMPRLCS